MTTLTETRVRNRAARATTYTSARAKLAESVRTASITRTYDVFLSHSVRDAEIVLGVKLWLEDHGRSVYVDWIDDPSLDRSRVTAATAETIRVRMRNCLSLLYVHTENSGDSTWMPWELGYFDGFKGTVAVLPVTRNEQDSFTGQEYLGIYPYVDEGMVALGAPNSLRILKSRFDYKDWRGWVANPQSLRKTV